MIELLWVALLLFAALLFGVAWVAWCANREAARAIQELEAFCWDAEVVQSVLTATEQRDLESEKCVTVFKEHG